MQRARDRARLSLSPERRAAYRERDFEIDVDVAVLAAEGAQDAVDGLDADLTSGVKKPAESGTFTGRGALADLDTAGAAQIATDAITNPKVQAGQITPYYSAFTAGQVIWTAESTLKTVQTVVATVIRGAVVINGLINVNDFEVTSVATIATLKLFRDGVEISTAAVQLAPHYGGSASVWHPPRQWALQYIDTPGAGTFTYTLQFQPGAVASGSVGRRSLIITPMEG